MKEVRQYLVDDMRAHVRVKLLEAFSQQVKVASTTLTPDEGRLALGGALAGFIAEATAGCAALVSSGHDDVYDAIAAEIASTLVERKQVLLPVLKALQTAVFKASVERTGLKL
ncbi:MAG: hypothetical protein WCY29_16070 [Novosphingobium sp.]